MPLYFLKVFERKSMNKFPTEAEYVQQRFMNTKICQNRCVMHIVLLKTSEHFHRRAYALARERHREREEQKKREQDQEIEKETGIEGQQRIYRKRRKGRKQAAENSCSRRGRALEEAADFACKPRRSRVKGCKAKSKYIGLKLPQALTLP